MCRREHSVHCTPNAKSHGVCSITGVLVVLHRIGDSFQDYF